MVQNRIKYSSKWLPTGAKNESATILEYFFDEKRKMTRGRYICQCGNRGVFSPCDPPKRCNHCRIKKLSSKFYFKMNKIEKEQLIDKLKKRHERERLKEIEIK